jgi:hypothetical protein
MTVRQGEQDPDYVRMLAGRFWGTLFHAVGVCVPLFHKPICGPTEGG